MRRLSLLCSGLFVITACGDEMSPEMWSEGGGIYHLTENNGAKLNSLRTNNVKLNNVKLNSAKLNSVKLNSLKLNNLNMRSWLYDGVAFNSAQRDNWQKVMQYAIECALQKNQNIVARDKNGNWKTFAGDMGLAPWWQTQNLYPSPSSYCRTGGRGTWCINRDYACNNARSYYGEKAVTSCLAARTNGAGITVTISIKGVKSFYGQTSTCTSANRIQMITRTTSEGSAYPSQEGKFWGNIFRYPHEIWFHPEGAGDNNLGRTCACGNDMANCGFRESTNSDKWDDDGVLGVVTYLPSTSGGCPATGLYDAK